MARPSRPVEYFKKYNKDHQVCSLRLTEQLRADVQKIMAAIELETGTAPTMTAVIHLLMEEGIKAVYKDLPRS